MDARDYFLSETLLSTTLGAQCNRTAAEPEKVPLFLVLTITYRWLWRRKPPIYLLFLLLFEVLRKDFVKTLFGTFFEKKSNHFIQFFVFYFISRKSIFLKIAKFSKRMLTAALSGTSHRKILRLNHPLEAKIPPEKCLESERRVGKQHGHPWFRGKINRFLSRGGFRPIIGGSNFFPQISGF